MKTDSAKRCLLIGNFLFHIRYSVTTDQKSFGIDSVWSTGKKCYKIFPSSTEREEVSSGFTTEILSTS